jgi:hypothetical protein
MYRTPGSEDLTANRLLANEDAITKGATEGAY